MTTGKLTREELETLRAALDSHDDITVAPPAPPFSTSAYVAERERQLSNLVGDPVHGADAMRAALGGAKWERDLSESIREAQEHVDEVQARIDAAFEARRRRRPFIPLLDENDVPINLPPYGTPIIATLGRTVIHGTIGSSQGPKYIDVDLIPVEGRDPDSPFLQDYTLWLATGWKFEITEIQS